MRSAGLSLVIFALLFCDTALCQDEPPPSPFAPRVVPRQARHGIVELSDGTTYEGEIYLTRDKMFRIFDRRAKMYRDFPIAAIAEIRVSVEKEQMEREWRWKEGGSNVKVYTGRSYPWRKYVTTIVLTNGQEFTGDSTTLFYVKTDKGTKKFILHRRDKGPIGSKLSDLIYVKRIRFTTERAQSKTE